MIGMALQILKMFMLLSALFATHETFAFKLNSHKIEPNSFAPNLQVIPNLPSKEYIQQIYSMLNAFKMDVSSDILAQANELLNTKYQILKRNGDLINSLLSLPKGMLYAGR